MILFYLLVSLAPMPNHPLFEEPLAGLTLIKWLGILCCGYALLRLLRTSRVPAFMTSWQARCFMMLSGIATISFLTLSKTEGLTFSPMATYFSYLLFFFITISVVNTYERLHQTLLAAVAGFAWASLYVIREFQLSGGTNMRPGYVTGDSNYFATCTLLVLPVAVYFAKLGSSRLERWFCGISLILILSAFTLASSRGGLVGLVVLAAYMIMRSGESRRSAILVVLLLLPLLLFSPSSPVARMLNPSYGDYVGAQVRRDFWQLGLNMIWTHPFTGIGLGNFTAQSFTFSRGLEGKHGIACNTFLEIAAELGIPGLLAYCAVILGGLSSAGNLRDEGQRQRDKLLQYTGQAIQAGLLGFSAAAIFVSAEYQKPFWVIIALSATVPNLLRQQARKRSRQTKPFGAPTAEMAAAKL